MMKQDTTLYSLQLRPIEPSSGSLQEFSALEVVAQPSGSASGSPGAIRGLFPQWEPIFERICAFVSSSPFHRKAMHRSLRAGLPTHLIDRATGGKQLFSREQIAELRLDQEIDPAA
jgi:hypothetical protein